MSLAEQFWSVVGEPAAWSKLQVGDIFTCEGISPGDARRIVTMVVTYKGEGDNLQARRASEDEIDAKQGQIRFHAIMQQLDEEANR